MQAALAKYACGRCVGWSIRWGGFKISRIDSHFGVGGAAGGTQPDGSPLSSAYAVLFKVGRTWRVLEFGSADIGCHQMPRIVRKDLGLSCSHTRDFPP
jgi:hypothetical protein